MKRLYFKSGIVLCLGLFWLGFAQSVHAFQNTDQGKTVNETAGDRYTVKPGDTLFSISRLFSLSVEDLLAFNGLPNDATIKAGMELVTSAPARPGAPSEGLPSADSGAQIGSATSGTETLDSIALRLGLASEQLMILNPGIEMVIAQMNRVPLQPEAALASTYTVKAGDTLFGVARKHGLSVGQLSEFNSLTETGIRSGQKLKIPGESTTGSTMWSSNGIIDAMMYPNTLSKRMLAGGIPYSEDVFVVGHSGLPVGTLIMIGKELDGPTVLCIVVDEGLSVDKNVLDVSAAVAQAVGLTHNERIEVFTLK